MSAKISLDDKYAEDAPSAFMSGSQALVRLPMVQMRRDRDAGLKTATFISGYRGSPLGGYDQQLLKARSALSALDIVFQPGVNEDLAATAVWGSQQASLWPGATHQGVVGLWYGKGPGVDRSGDVFKHGAAAGSARFGGVLAIAGDDHTCKSSTIPHQSDHAFISALMPVLYPSSVHEFIELGLLGVAMSRYSGCWVGFKVISETVETSSVLDLTAERGLSFAEPTDFERPADGLNLRWPDPPLAQDARLQEQKGYAAIAFARANGVDRLTADARTRRLGVIASGKAYEDVVQALEELGLGPDEREAIGLSLYKVRMPWPLEPEGVRRFSQGLEEILIVEERREIIENQIKQQLFNWRSDVRPRIVGKFDEEDRPFLSLSAGLTVGAVARALADRILRFELPDGLAQRISETLSALERRAEARRSHAAPVTRLPHYCAGCPHNTSTKVPDGSRAMAGIGCHYMVQWMDRNTETVTQMGGEGVPWTAISRFTDERHRFVNLGDGTYFHSGLLAIRQSVAAGANITYKVLYNDAVAMTGGQAIDGELTPQQITRQLHNENVKRIHLLTDAPDQFKPWELAPGVVAQHRDELDSVMRTLRDVEGVTAIVYVQTCAAELRRRRKRGEAPDPEERVFIHPEVCEGCGDCSVQSNCIAIEPLETEFGRKRAINQSACNKDFSCLKGFCPSFVTIKGGALRRRAATDGPDVGALPDPTQPPLERPWNIVVTGVGGTGVLTIGALIGMAAHLDGKSPLIMDMAGLAQKGGAVMSHIRIAAAGASVRAPRIVNGGADLLIGADAVVAASADGVSACDPERTEAVLNVKVAPTSDFVRMRDFDFKAAAIEEEVARVVRARGHFHDFSRIASEIAGDEIAANVMMLGYACQCGLVPVSVASIERAIEMNRVAVRANLNALAWGRLLAVDPAAVRARLSTQDRPPRPQDMNLEALIAHRRSHLTAYQDAALADRYAALVDRVRESTRGRTDGEILARTVAANYARLLSYKDEYEVARLFSEPVFQARLDAQFDGAFDVAFNLAPPFLPGKTPDGRPRKRRFGGLMRRVFPLLARMKRLRGTRWDVFGYTAERRAERALIVEYEADVDRVLALGERADPSVAVDLLNAPDQIRGFGPVKLAAMEAHRSRRAELSERLVLRAQEPVAAE